MNGKQRILKALSIEEPDRVPLFIHGINEDPIMGVGKHLMEGLPIGKQVHQMTDSEKGVLIETLLRLLEEFEIDGYTCLPIGPGTEFSPDADLVDDWGVGFTRSPHGIPVPSRHPVQTVSALDRYEPPAPSREHLVMVDLMKDRFGSSKAVFWMMRGVFVRSWRLIGMQNFMMMMYDNPDFIHRVAEMVTQFSLGQLDMLIEAGLDVLIVEDDIADKNNTLISPDQFKTFINPYNRKLVDRAHAAGLKVVRHSDGNLWSILDLLLDSGYDGLNPLEPPAGMDIGLIKEKYGDRLCFFGGVNCETLIEGTPARARDEVRYAIEHAAAGGGLGEEHEDIRTVALPVSEALQQMEAGEINDAKTIIGLQWLKINRPA